MYVAYDFDSGYSDESMRFASWIDAQNFVDKNYREGNFAIRLED